MSTKTKCIMKVEPFPYSHRSHREHCRRRRNEFVRGLLENRQATMDAAAKTWGRVLYPGCINAGGGGVGSLLQSYAERVHGVAPAVVKAAEEEAEEGGVKGHYQEKEGGDDVLVRNEKKLKKNGTIEANIIDKSIIFIAYS